MPWTPWHKTKPTNLSGAGSLSESPKMMSASELNESIHSYNFDMGKYINKPEQKNRIYYVRIDNGRIIEQ